MALEDVMGAPRRALKFISLTIAILMAAATVTCMIYGRPWWIAVAAGVVSAWAMLIFTELFKEELREIVRSAQVERRAERQTERKDENLSQP